MTVEEAIKCCERLSPLEISRLLKQDNIDPDAGSGSIDPGIAMNLWFNDLLSIWPLTVDERIFVSSEFKKPISEFGQYVDSEIHDSDANIPSLPVSFIGLGDRKYVAFTGNADILDLTTGKYVPGTRVQFLETIQYNLTTLYVIRYLRTGRLNKPQAGKTNDLSGTTPK